MEEKVPSLLLFMGMDILKGTNAFNSIPHFAFLLISKAFTVWSYNCFRVFETLQKFGKIAPVPVSIVLPSFIFSVFRASNYYSNNEVKELFWLSDSGEIGK